MKKYEWFIFYCIGILYGSLLMFVNDNCIDWINNNVILWIIIIVALGVIAGLFHWYFFDKD